jgi:hypothetical protein
MLTEAFLWPAVTSKRAAGADPDAGSLEAHRGLAVRSGELDRGSVTGTQIDRLKGAGMQIVTKIYPHDWT